MLQCAEFFKFKNSILAAINASKSTGLEKENKIVIKFLTEDL